MKKKVCTIVTAGLLGAALLVPGAALAAEKGNFSDVKGHFAQKHIEMLTEKGIVSGIGMGKFAPNQTISQEHMEMLLKKASGKEVKLTVNHRVAFVAATVYAFDLTAEANKLSDADIQAALGKFTDKDMIPAEDVKAVAYLLKEGVVSGAKVTEFKPHVELTRAETATMLGRLSDKGKITMQNYIGHKQEKQAMMKDKEALMQDKQAMMTEDMKAKMDAKMADMKAMMGKNTGMMNDLKALVEQLKKDGKLSSEQLKKYEEIEKQMAEHQAMMDKKMQDMMSKDMKAKMDQKMEDMMGKDMAGMGQATAPKQDQQAAAQSATSDQHTNHVNQG